MNIQYRFAEYEDEDEVIELISDNAASIGFYIENNDGFDPIKNRIGVGQCIVAEDVSLSPAKIVGCIGYEMSKTYVDICDLVVADDYRRNHIASKLIKYVCFDAKKVLNTKPMIRIAALETNIIAKEFYSKIGKKLYENKNEGSIIYKVVEQRVTL